jgi:hypothetical protein
LELRAAISETSAKVPSAGHLVIHRVGDGGSGSAITADH